MISIDPKEVSTPQLHGYLLGAIGPRPIAFASTIDKLGRPNLSPFSFFNVFSANPPILIFSPARRVRNNTTKHTLENTTTGVNTLIMKLLYVRVKLNSVQGDHGPRWNMAVVFVERMVHNTLPTSSSFCGYSRALRAL